MPADSPSPLTPKRVLGGIALVLGFLFLATRSNSGCCGPSEASICEACEPLNGYVCAQAANDFLCSANVELATVQYGEVPIREVVCGDAAAGEDTAENDGGTPGAQTGSQGDESAASPPAEASSTVAEESADETR